MGFPHVEGDKCPCDSCYELWGTEPDTEMDTDLEPTDESDPMDTESDLSNSESATIRKSESDGAETLHAEQINKQNTIIDAIKSRGEFLRKQHLGTIYQLDDVDVRTEYSMKPSTSNDFVRTRDVAVTHLLENFREPTKVTTAYERILAWQSAISLDTPPEDEYDEATPEVLPAGFALTMSQGLIRKVPATVAEACEIVSKEGYIGIGQMSRQYQKTLAMSGRNRLDGPSLPMRTICPFPRRRRDQFVRM